MALGQFREYLLPGAAERDPAFRREIQRLSVFGLKVVGTVEIAMPLLFLLIYYAFIRVWPRPEIEPVMRWRSLCLVATGLLTLAAARIAWCRPRARLLGGVSGWLSAAILIVTALMMSKSMPWADRYVPGMAMMVLLVGITGLPLRPMHTLAMGLAIEAFYLVAAFWSKRFLPGGPLDPFDHISVVTTTLLCTALTALIYRERVSERRAHAEALRNFEDLCKVRSQAARSESAASLARLVAAFSHELNTPMGALRSAVDTLLVLAARQATTPPEDQQRLIALQADLRKSVANSADRLRLLVTRMQRLANLDKADIQETNLNELIGDVAALLEPQARGRVRLELKFRPIPPMVCRPQQLGAVFSNLLSNAMDAVDGDGSVVVSTRQIDSRVEVDIKDDGRGMDPDQVSAIFDPGFRVLAGGVASGHWSLFGARQVVREHGGDIQIDSLKGKGTRVSVTLPLGPPR